MISNHYIYWDEKLMLKKITLSMFVSSWLKNLALCREMDLPDFQEQNIFVTSGLLKSKLKIAFSQFKMIELGAVKIFRGKVATTAKTNASSYSRFS